MQNICLDQESMFEYLIQIGCSQFPYWYCKGTESFFQVSVAHIHLSLLPYPHGKMNTSCPVSHLNKIAFLCVKKCTLRIICTEYQRQSYLSHSFSVWVKISSLSQRRLEEHPFQNCIYLFIWQCSFLKEHCLLIFRTKFC